MNAVVEPADSRTSHLSLRTFVGSITQTPEVLTEHAKQGLLPNVFKTASGCGTCFVGTACLLWRKIDSTRGNAPTGQAGPHHVPMCLCLLEMVVSPQCIW